MRVSIRPRSTTAKAASWPLISGSLVGNNFRCLDKLRALHRTNCQLRRGYFFSAGAGGGGGGGMFGMFGILPLFVASPIGRGCGCGFGLGSGIALSPKLLLLVSGCRRRWGWRNVRHVRHLAASILSRYGRRWGWCRSAVTRHNFPPYEKSSSRSEIALDLIRLIHRFFSGKTGLVRSISSALARSSLSNAFAAVSSIVPSSKSYHNCSYFRYRVSNSKDAFRNSFSFFRNGIYRIAICITCPVAIMVAQIVAWFCQMAHDATLDPEITASVKAKSRARFPDTLAHSQAYNALNLILASCLQSRLRNGLEAA